MDIILIGGLWLDASAWDAVLPGLRDALEYVDIDSGHWPMFSKPDELARVIADLAT